MIVYFLRHASAGSHKADPKKDEKRALDENGIEQCGMMGRALAALDVHVDVTVTSPLKRAAQTAALVANEVGYEGKLLMDASLRPEGSYESFRKLLERYADREAVLVVGHNPNLSEFLARLLGARSGGSVDLKKGAVAKVEFDQKRPALEWCLSPKLVRAIHESAASSSRPKSSRK
ncbi:MAG TPA: phosphohistidine phosphatase SixA [Terriglobales bacterium]|nr:phosphohistidine phosphatase SixA [Terriglobales bacterium]